MNTDEGRTGKRAAGLFPDERMSMSEARELTSRVYDACAARYDHWIVAFSGGKDSCATLADLRLHILEGRIRPPKSLTVRMSDTRMDLPPLVLAAREVLAAARELDWGCEFKAETVEPPLDDRFLVKMFGYGYPPPHNKMRWCTRLLKKEPMGAAILGDFRRDGRKRLTLTGLRVGESAARDRSIVTSCSKDDGECGAGWFQLLGKEDVEAADRPFPMHYRKTAAGQPSDSLAPIAHWRVCLVLDMLGWELETRYSDAHGLPTPEVARLYGAYEEGTPAEEGTRFGCAGCNLVEEDKSLARTSRMPDWSYITPLQRLQPLWRELQQTPRFRLRKVDELRKDKSPAAKQGRKGPLTFEAREYGIERVLNIQREVNEAARSLGRPEITLIDDEELARMRELISLGTYPEGWDGTERRADEMYQITVGAQQSLLPDGWWDA